jgi:hypothetical protein
MKFLTQIKKYAQSRPKTRKLIGGIVVLVGFIGVLLPVVPGLWLVFFGLELLGIQILFFDKMAKFIKKHTERIGLSKET